MAKKKGKIISSYEEAMKQGTDERHKHFEGFSAAERKTIEIMAQIYVDSILKMTNKKSLENYKNSQSNLQNE